MRLPYTLVVLGICYCPGSMTAREIAARLDDAAAIDTYADGVPVTLRCPVSPRVNERPILVSQQNPGDPPGYDSAVIGKARQTDTP